MPLPQNIWLFYSVNCADTFYPDHFCWRLPLFNHIIPRVMWYCSFSQWSQINWSSFTPTRLCLYFTNTSLLCKCFFPPCLCFAFAIAHLWAVFFHFSDFGRIHLKFLLPFHIVPSFHPLSFTAGLGIYSRPQTDLIIQSRPLDSVTESGTSLSRVSSDKIRPWSNKLFR